jgi:Kef-type K+ transport system membrane component KefB
MGIAEQITLSNTELTRTFFATVLLLVSAHFFGFLFHRAKLPRVIGEIVGGCLLGPTGLGFVSPRTYRWIFSAFEEQGKLISFLYWFGLILLMFLSGFEIQKSFDRKDRKLIAATLLGATIVPLLAGWMAPALFDFTPYLGTKGNVLALRIVIAIAVAVTSIPVISKIFIDLDIIHTSFAKIVLATATIQDVLLWIALAIATGLVSSGNMSLLSIAYTVFITMLFFGLALYVMPGLIRLTSSLRWNFLVRSSASGYIMVICFLFAAIASVLEVNIVFGAFLAGIVIGLLPQDSFEKEKKQIRDISLGFFIPIYFAVVGLKLDLIHHFDLRFFLGFLLFTTFFESIGTFIAARLALKDWLSSFNLAVAMNTRGGPGIVLATVAFDLGIINQTFFVTLVLVAIVTSLLAGYWFKFVLAKGWTLLRL